MCCSGWLECLSWSYTEFFSSARLNFYIYHYLSHRQHCWRVTSQLFQWFGNLNLNQRRLEQARCTWMAVDPICCTMMVELESEGHQRSSICFYMSHLSTEKRRFLPLAPIVVDGYCRCFKSLRISGIGMTWQADSYLDCNVRTIVDERLGLMEDYFASKSHDDQNLVAWCTLPLKHISHYSGVIMGAMASQITSLAIYSGVPNHQPNRLFRHRSKKTSKLRVTDLCVGNSPVTGEFPAQMASNA